MILRFKDPGNRLIAESLNHQTSIRYIYSRLGLGITRFAINSPATRDMAISSTRNAVSSPETT